MLWRTSAFGQKRKGWNVKNIQIFDGADNAVYDVFAAADEEFDLIFPDGTDVAFIDEVYQNQPADALNAAFSDLQTPCPQARSDGHSRHPLLRV